MTKLFVLLVVLESLLLLSACNPVTAPTVGHYCSHVEPCQPINPEAESEGDIVTFQTGQTVRIPCQIQGGAFSNEYLVSIATEEGIISGFADQRDVRPDPKNHERGTIRATIVDLNQNGVKVRIYGSFFTTAAGMMQFSANWANTNLQAAS